MISLNFKLAVLHVLAKWPERRATLDEVRREIGIIIVNGEQTEQLKRFSVLGDIDIFQSGLVSRDKAGLQITEAGLSLLHSLGSSSEFFPEVSSAPASQPFRLIDDLVGTEERLKIFDLELSTLESGAGEGNDHQSEQEGENGFEPIGTPDATWDACAAVLPGGIDSQISDETGDGNRAQPSADGSNRTIATAPPDAESQSAPAFLRRSFGSKVQQPGQNSSRLAGLLASIAAKTRPLLKLWRQHFTPGVSMRTEHPVGRTGGIAFAVLSLAVVVIAIGAAIALGQIKSLKSEIATLHRELLPLRERVGKLEQTEKAKRESDQQEAAPDKSGKEKNKPGEESRADQGGLSLSREEVELIRNYIKPSPLTDIAAPAINVGDPIGTATIPLPSQLMEKIPKLLGARFTTRNGAIIIVKRNSHQADAVLPSQ
jgi:hypothetical protein